MVNFSNDRSVSMSEANDNLVEFIFDSVLKKWMLGLMHQSLMHSAGNDVDKAIELALSLVKSVEEDLKRELTKPSAEEDDLVNEMTLLIGSAEEERIRSAASRVGQQIELMFRNLSRSK